MICAFTGHRPEKLPWGSDETDERCAALKMQIKCAVEAAVRRGFTSFACGFARGCDLYFAEAVLSVRENCPEIMLEAWIPCPEQADRWDEKTRQRRDRLLLQCSAIHVTAQTYYPGCMLERNRQMVLAARALISVWDGSTGGTARTVQTAQNAGIPVYPIWL